MLCMAEIDLSPDGIRERYQQLRSQNLRLRTKDAAQQLGLSEEELVAAQIDAERIVRLRPDFEAILTRVESLGEVMALTRNEFCVHEKNGTYRNFDFSGHAALVLDKEIDLRMFLGQWKRAYAVVVNNPRGDLFSLQFFNARGEAIHKIFVMPDGNVAAYQTLVETFKADNQDPGVEVDGSAKRAASFNPNPETEKFLADWEALKDTHDFYGLIRKHKLPRTQALSLAEGRFSEKVLGADASRFVLHQASQRKIPIMIFVGNGANIQIHTGEVDRIKEANGWLNVLDERFNLHLNIEGISDAWVVYKPTEDGVVTSLELFDRAGAVIVQFFGARKPGIPERKDWKLLIHDLLKG